MSFGGSPRLVYLSLGSPRLISDINNIAHLTQLVHLLAAPSYHYHLSVCACCSGLCGKFSEGLNHCRCIIAVTLYAHFCSFKSRNPSLLPNFPPSYLCSTAPFLPPTLICTSLALTKYPLANQNISFGASSRQTLTHSLAHPSLTSRPVLNSATKRQISARSCQESMFGTVLCMSVRSHR